MRKLVLLGFLVTLSACMASMPPKHSMVSSFDPSEVEWFASTGTNSVHGSALIRQRGGGVVTCAGRSVSLMPVSTYADERILAIYGNRLKGYSQFGATVINEPPDQAYLDIARNSTCDAQGFFSFRNLPDGEFYIITDVFWEVSNYASQGGALMHRVTLSGGKSAEVVLSP